MTKEFDYTKLNTIYKGIEEYCKNCNKCCFTYGWILSSERKMYEKITDLITINNEVECFDSFHRDEKGQIVLEKIPRCKFYRNRQCTIHKLKPFDCFLYPVKILYNANKKVFDIVISLDCPFIKSLDKKEMKILINKFLHHFEELPKELREEYLDIVEKWAKITRPKSFDHIKIAEITKTSSFYTSPHTSLHTPQTT